MTSVIELRSSHFRNLESLQIRPNSSFNILFGENASGKTSLLEALYLLSSNRSFRTNKLQHLIHYRSDSLSVFALAQTDMGEKRIGLAKERKGDTSIKIDGSLVKRSSELAFTLPCIAIQPSSFELIDGSPSFRRSLLDWLVFHVKPNFLSTWKSYQRCLKQRNMMLRSGKIARNDLLHWDELLVTAAVDVEQERIEALASINQALQSIRQNSPFDLDALDVSLKYKSGWGKLDAFPQEQNQTDSSASLELAHNQDDRGFKQKDVLLKQARKNWYLDRLTQCFEQDLKLGYSQLGSHKHDIKINTENGPASELLSRGQKKTLILSIYLSLAQLVSDETSKRSVFLLDDLPSELDERHLAWLCLSLNALGSQVFISTVSHDCLTELDIFKSEIDFSLFHVKHGLVEQVGVDV